jgi:hypothetical protein
MKKHKPLLPGASFTAAVKTSIDMSCIQMFLPPKNVQYPKGNIVLLASPSLRKGEYISRIMKLQAAGILYASDCQSNLEIVSSVVTRPLSLSDYDREPHSSISLKQFYALEARGAFLETSAVYLPQIQYGTLLSSVHHIARNYNIAMYNVNLAGGMRIHDTLTNGSQNVLTLFLDSGFEEAGVYEHIVVQNKRFTLGMSNKSIAAYIAHSHEHYMSARTSSENGLFEHIPARDVNRAMGHIIKILSGTLPSWITWRDEVISDALS